MLVSMISAKKEPHEEPQDTGIVRALEAHMHHGKKRNIQNDEEENPIRKRGIGSAPLADDQQC